MSSNVKGYEAIEAEASRLGWPTHFTADLTKHDYAILNDYDAPTRFGWSVRECGTDLYRVGNEWSIAWLQSHIEGGPQ